MTPSRNLRTTLKATPLQVALAWLLKRSKVILPIPGTSSIKHLEENIAAAALELPQAAYDRLASVSHRTCKSTWLKLTPNFTSLLLR